MATLSSNTLFHFTPTAESLISILTNEFHPRYCLENIYLGGTMNTRAVPMVCFCDIPLSQIKNHTDTYGTYGIGMTKEWAQKKLLNPILYLRDKSALSNNLLKILTAFKKDELKGNVHLDDAKLAYLNTMRYLKPYAGNIKRRGVVHKNVRFYNEREWRYTPEWNDKTPFWLDKKEFENPVTLAQANETLKSQKLTFEPYDIQYIIIKEESEIYPMIEALKTIKSKYGPRTIEILNSRIITHDQIIKDF